MCFCFLFNSIKKGGIIIIKTDIYIFGNGYGYVV